VRPASLAGSCDVVESSSALSACLRMVGGALRLYCPPEDDPVAEVVHAWWLRFVAYGARRFAYVKILHALGCGAGHGGSGAHAV
jgi:hypothetical protein